MTPSLFDLPVRTAEAAALASLILDQAERKPLTDELRNRIASRAAALKLESIMPYFGSLERDPIHSSPAYYLAVDGAESQPLLLRMAPASTPSSGLFPKSILIGRFRGTGLHEIVVSAVPFSHSDSESVLTFAEQVNPSFLPNAVGHRSTITVMSDAPALAFPAAFETFRSVLKSRAINLACFTGLETAVWAAIRAGWREGYGVEAEGLSGPPTAVRDVIRRSVHCSSFTALHSDFETSLQIYDALREIKGNQKQGRAFDFCLAFDHDAGEVLENTLQQWKQSGRPIQMIAPHLESASNMTAISKIARRFQIVLRVPSREYSALNETAKATGARVNCRISIQPGNAAEQILALAPHVN